MARKISIAIAPKRILTINLPDRETFKDPAQFAINSLDFIGRNFSIFITLFLFLLPSLKAEYSYPFLTIGIYAIAIILVLVQILRIINVKGPHFLSIPFDIPLLIFTTFIALSFFYNTAIARSNNNIWGGLGLSAISGVSIIALSLIYYFFYINNQSSSRIRNLISAFKWSPLVSFISIIVFNLQISPAVIDLFSIIFPAQLIWTLYVHFSNKSKPKIDFLNILNLLISLFCLLYFYNPINLLINVISLLVIFITLIVLKRDELAKMFKNLDKSYKSIYERIQSNFNLSLLLLVFVLISIGTYLLLKNPNYPGFNLNALSDLSGVSLFFGKGLLFKSSMPLFFQFIYVYGIVPLISLVYLGFLFTKFTLSVLKDLKNSQARVLLKTLVVLIISIFLFLLLSSSISIFPIFLIVGAGSFILLIAKMFLKNGKEFNFSSIPHSFESLSEDRAYFLKIFRIILVVLLILFSINLLSSLNYINIFINA